MQNDQKKERLAGLERRITTHLENIKKNPNCKSQDPNDLLYYLFDTASVGCSPQSFKFFTVELMAEIIRCPLIVEKFKLTHFVNIDAYFKSLFYFFDSLDESETFPLTYMLKDLENDGTDEKLDWIEEYCDFNGITIPS